MAIYDVATQITAGQVSTSALGRELAADALLTGVTFGILGSGGTLSSGVRTGGSIDVVPSRTLTAPEIAAMDAVVLAHAGVVTARPWRVAQVVKVGHGSESVLGADWIMCDCVQSDPHSLTPTATARMGQLRLRARCDADMHLQVLEDATVVASVTVASTAGAWTEVVLFTSAPTAGPHMYHIEGKGGSAQADIQGASLALLAR